MEKQCLRKHFALVGAMMALVGLSGCLEMESTITVNKDGSGQLSEKIVFERHRSWRMMNMGGGADGEDPMAKFSEEEPEGRRQPATAKESSSWRSSRRRKTAALLFTSVLQVRGHLER